MNIEPCFCFSLPRHDIISSKERMSFSSSFLFFLVVDVFGFYLWKSKSFGWLRKRTDAKWSQCFFPFFFLVQSGQIYFFMSRMRNAMKYTIFFFKWMSLFLERNWLILKKSYGILKEGLTIWEVFLKGKFFI